MPLPQLFVIGDSISMQYGPYLQAMLAGRYDYARKEAIDQPAGAPGYLTDANGGDSSMVLGYLTHKLQEPTFAPDVLLLNCGLHDIKTDPQGGEKQVASEAYAANLRQILTALQPTAITPFWVRTTPVDDAIHNSRSTAFHRFAADVIAYNAIADEIMAANDVPCIDLNRFTANLGPELYIDHVHFTDVVRAQQAAFIAGHLLAWSAGG